MSAARFIECCGVLLWRAPFRKTTGPREFADLRHRQDYDRLVQRSFEARIRARGPAIVRAHQPVPRLIEASGPLLLRAV